MTVVPLALVPQLVTAICVLAQRCRLTSDSEAAFERLELLAAAGDVASLYAEALAVLNDAVLRTGHDAVVRQALSGAITAAIRAPSNRNARTADIEEVVRLHFDKLDATAPWIFDLKTRLFADGCSLADAEFAADVPT